MVTYKPIIKWKYVWKTVTYTVTKYKTVWETVTETKTRTYYTYKTVTEKVTKEKREYFRILITEGFTVINEQTNEKMSLQQFFLFIMGFREDVLGQIIKYLEAKIFGPALNLINQLIDFLINVTKRFLIAVIENLFSRLLNLLLTGLTVHTLKYSGSDVEIDEYEDYATRSGDLLWRSNTNGKIDPLEPTDRPFNFADAAHKLHARQRRDLAESTRLTIGVRTIEAHAEYLVTGKRTPVFIPLTTEVLVATVDETGEFMLGWRDMNKYDHTVYMDADMRAKNAGDPGIRDLVPEHGEFPVGVTRQVYVMVIPGEESLTERKLAIAYSVDIANDETKLVPDALRDFVDMTKNQNDYTKALKYSFDDQYGNLKRALLGPNSEKEITTYGELREAIASKYGLSADELSLRVEKAVEYTRMSGREVAFVESGGTRTQFFVLKKRITYTDSNGEVGEYFPWALYGEEFKKEFGSRKKYDDMLSVYHGLYGDKFFNKYKEEHDIAGGEAYINELLEKKGFDFATGEKVARSVFKKVCEIAKKNDVSASGVLHILIPSLVTEVEGVHIIGESDEFHNNRKAMTIIAPSLDNPFAALFLDYFRAYEETIAEKIRDDVTRNRLFKTSQIKIFRKSIVDAYRLVILFDGDPDNIKIKVKYEDDKGVLRNTELSLSFLMEHAEDFGVQKSNHKPRRIELDGSAVPVDRVVEGITRLKIEQRGGTVTVYPLDEDLNPIEEEKTTFSVEERGKGMYFLKLSEHGKIRGRQLNGVSELFFAAEKLVYKAMDACFKELTKKTPELDAKFGNLLADVEFLGQNPREAAGFLVFLLVSDTKGSEKSYTLVKRYLFTMARDEKMLREILTKMEELVRDDEIVAKLNLTDKEVKSIREAIGTLREEIDHLKDPANPEHLKKRSEEKTDIIPWSFNKAVKYRERVRTILDVLRVYITKLLGGEEGMKQIGKDAAVGVVVGLMYPVVADTIMTLDLSILEELLDRDPKTFFALMSDDSTKRIVGLGLSVIAFTLLNLDIGRILKGHSADLGVGHSKSLIRELLGQLFDFKMIFATVITGFGMMLRGIVGMPFYISEEIEKVIGEQIHEHVGDTAGEIWDMTAGYRIPGVDMTVFEFALTLVLQGNSGIFQLIITGLTKAVEYLLSEIIGPIVEPVVAEYAYLFARDVLE